MSRTLIALLTAYSVSAFANPYPIEELVPRDSAYPRVRAGAAPRAVPLEQLQLEGLPVLRVRVDWHEADESYSFGAAVEERSGTPALFARSHTLDPLGSYHALIRDSGNGQVLAYDAIGTGKEYRKLARAISFRFPMIDRMVKFEMTAENPLTGVQEKVLERDIHPPIIEHAALTTPEVKILKAATAEPKLLVNVYADGYLAEGKARFWTDAQKVVTGFTAGTFPSLDHLEIRAVFMPSNVKLGPASDLGLPVRERDSALGLYYPYWDDFGRWYNVLYPTSEEKFRTALAQVPYDYPIVVVDSAAYFGVGNYKTHTALPAKNGSFTYLLLHEFGHFLGLNEEYVGGGRTELEFAPLIEEPWSQNMTFLRSHQLKDLKWRSFVSVETALPTPASAWYATTPHPYGAYSGGYGDSDLEHNHKPGLSCAMENDPNYCPICAHAVEEVLKRDLSI